MKARIVTIFDTELDKIAEILTKNSIPFTIETKDIEIFGRNMGTMYSYVIIINNLEEMQGLLEIFKRFDIGKTPNGDYLIQISSLEV